MWDTEVTHRNYKLDLTQIRTINEVIFNERSIYIYNNLRDSRLSTRKTLKPSTFCLRVHCTYYCCEL